MSRSGGTPGHRVCEPHLDDFDLFSNFFNFYYHYYSLFFFLNIFFSLSLSLGLSLCLSSSKDKRGKTKKNDVYKYNFFSVSLAALSYSSPFSSSHLPSPTDRSGFSYLDLLNVPHSLQNRGFRLICATSSICRLSTHGFNVDGGGDDSCLSILGLMRLDDLI